MELIKRIDYRWTIIVLLFIGIFIREGCHAVQLRESDKLAIELAAYKDTCTTYLINKGKADSVRVATNSVLELTNQEQLRAISQKNTIIAKLQSQFKTLSAVLQVKETISLPADTFKLPKKIPCDFEPITLRKETPEMKFVGVVDPFNFFIDTLAIKNTQSIVMGEKKNGLFGRIKTVDIANSNPMISSNAISGYVADEQKWYENKWIWFGAGCITTAGGVILLSGH